MTSPCSFVTNQVGISSPSYDSSYTQKHRVQHPMPLVKISPSRLRYGSYPSPIRCSRSQTPLYRHPIIHEEPPKQTTQENLLFDMKFSLDVAKHVILENLRENKSMAFSPTSVDTVLRILATGAQNSTLKQFLNLLGHSDVRELNAAAAKLSDVLNTSDIDEKVLEMSYVNGLWLNQNFSFKDGFKKVLSEVYDAQTRVGDFVNKVDEVVEEANSWANQVTKGMIPQILTRNDINKDTILVVANALYFRGTWLNAFETKDTKDGAFNLLDGHQVDVPFMHQRGNKFEFGDFNTCKVIRMPYNSNVNSSKSLSMYAFLPHEKDGLANLVEEIKINENMFNDQFKLENVKVDLLCIPKFKVESEVSLKETMKQLGLISPFDPICEDFTEIVNEPASPLFVNKIMQRCFVETSEEGTRAAAVTWSGYYGSAGMPRPPVEFVADHPFMFIIREDISGAILFVGTMLNPKEA